MARFGFLQSAALAVIAAAGALAVPAQAQDLSRQEARAAARESRVQVRQERRAEGAQRREDRGGAWQARAEAREQRRASAAQQRSASEGGWRSQRSAEGPRDRRDWGGRGAVDRPLNGYRSAEAQGLLLGDDGQRAWSGQRSERAGRDPQSAASTRVWARRNGDYRDGSPVRNSTDRERAYDHGDRARVYREGYRTRERDVYRSGGWNEGRRFSNRDREGRRWNDNWRSDRRFDWSSYRNSNRGLFSIGRYYSPYRNYRYSRLGIGVFLDSGFYGNRYWINDPWQYRLPEVYGPYRWVRYYDDVLLVDIYSGEVVDAIHDFFW